MYRVGAGVTCECFVSCLILNSVFNLIFFPICVILVCCTCDAVIDWQDVNWCGHRKIQREWRNGEEIQITNREETEESSIETSRSSRIKSVERRVKEWTPGVTKSTQSTEQQSSVSILVSCHVNRRLSSSTLHTLNTLKHSQNIQHDHHQHE